MRSTEKVVESKGASLATFAVGQPERGTMLLAMGATASMVWWPDSLVNALVEGGYQVIRFDHRDTGHSTTNPMGEVTYDLNDMADDLPAILDAYGIAQAHFVGMSLGGYLSQIVALRNPERVQSLTLVASEPFGVSYDAEGIPDSFMAHFGTMGSLNWTDREAVEAFLLRIAELSAGYRNAFDPLEASTRIKREMSRTDSIQSAFNHSLIAGQIDLRKTAKDLACPTLIIHGSDDPIISVNAALKSAAIIPNAELMILEGVGHELLAQDGPAIAQRILDHCAGA